MVDPFVGILNALPAPDMLPLSIPIQVSATPPLMENDGKPRKKAKIDPSPSDVKNAVDILARWYQKYPDAEMQICVEMMRNNLKPMINGAHIADEQSFSHGHNLNHLQSQMMSPGHTHAHLGAHSNGRIMGNNHAAVLVSAMHANHTHPNGISVSSNSASV
jgi:hypothetical protein